MGLKDIKKNKEKNTGFTIVELLVVIVVIGILAAITIVSYAGVTTKARTSASQSNAQSIQQVAEAYNADHGYYPGTIAAFSDSTNTAKKPSNVTVEKDNITTTAMTSTLSNNGTHVAYACYLDCTNSTGGIISYWDFTASAIVRIYVGAGTGTAGVVPATS